MNPTPVIMFALSLVAGLHIRTVRRGPVINIHAQERGDTMPSLTLSPRSFPRHASRRRNTENGRSDDVVIPFIITGQYAPLERGLILAAMEDISNNTCVRFRPRKDEKDYVNIRNAAGKGCFSYIGMQGGEQFLHLEASSLGSCMRFEIIIHELFHTVGLDHEHSRNDRDDYVKVHYENVKKGRESQFLKCLYPPEYDIPYDYKSIMHYHQRAFTKNNGITLETLDPQYQDVIGTAKKPSPNDYLKVCALYRCGTCMGKKVVIETLPVKPTTPASKHSSCYDVQPFICYIGLLHGLLNCKKPLHRQACCKTCKKTPHFDDFLNITQFLI